jgi:DNA polymerase I-like protein with 3'-5' exonuclease and polymerase domains
MIYGMGAKALGEQLEVGEEDASVFMDSFKNAYPGTVSHQYNVFFAEIKYGQLSFVLLPDCVSQ